MSKPLDDGGPAFPHGIERRLVDTYGGTEEHIISDFSYGMSLRDWFAGQALVGLGAWTPMSDHKGNSLPTGGGNLCLVETQTARAEWAYRQADAMLAARTRSTEQEG
jgi:hypothetical protein